MENQNSLRDDSTLPCPPCRNCKNGDGDWKIDWREGRCPACGERDDRLFPDQRDRALAAAYFVHASEHEWPTGEDLRLVCLALLISHTKIAKMERLLDRCAGAIADGVESAEVRMALYKDCRAMLDFSEGFIRL